MSQRPPGVERPGSRYASLPGSGYGQLPSDRVTDGDYRDRQWVRVAVAPAWWAWLFRRAHVRVLRRHLEERVGWEPAAARRIATSLARERVLLPGDRAWPWEREVRR